MPEKEHDNEHDGQNDFDDCFLNVVDGTLDQLGTIINRDDLDTGGRPGSISLIFC
jgi:hypothetical protein